MFTFFFFSFFFSSQANRRFTLKQVPTGKGDEMPLIGDLRRQISPEETDQNRHCYLRSGRVIVFETLPRGESVQEAREHLRIHSSSNQSAKVSISRRNGYLLTLENFTNF